MDLNEEIIKEQSKINLLRSEANNLFLPRKSIAFQLQNMRFGNRNQTQRAAIVKTRRRNIGHEILTSRKRINLLTNMIAKKNEI